MANENLIGLKALFDSADFIKGLADYSDALNKANSRTASGASDMERAWNGMAFVGGIAFGAIVTALAALITELGFATAAAMDAENEMARVDFVVSGTAERTGVTTEAVNALATSLTQVLPFDDEVMAQAIAMGLTFDGVNKDNIQPLIGAAADLAMWTGRDLPSTMKSLSMAISDPDKAMRLLKEASITLTDEEVKLFKGFKDTGDSVGATAFILEQLKKKGIIGLGEAMGQTAKGKMTIMQTALGNMQETLGGGLLDALKTVIDKITVFASDPKTLAFLADLGAKIGVVASQVITNLPGIMATIEGIATWLAQNKPVIVGVLAAIGVALLAFGINAAIAGAAAMAGLAPIIAIMAVVGLAAALLYQAWTTNFGGIQEKTAAVWAVIQPALAQLWTWLSTNIPIAIAVVSEYFTNVLLPAIMNAISWISVNVIPVLLNLWNWLSTNIPLAIATLSAFWTNTLLPAIMVVYDWIGANLVPLFSAIADLIGTVVMVALTAFAGFWQNVLLPNLRTVGAFITANILPVLNKIGEVVSTYVMPILTVFGDFIKNTLVNNFNGLRDIIGWITDRITELTDALANLELPDWLTPGSPTPFEVGLVGINAQLAKLSKATLPAVRHQLEITGGMRNVAGSSSGATNNSISNSNQQTRNYLYGAQFNVQNKSGLIDMLQGLA